MKTVLDSVGKAMTAAKAHAKKGERTKAIQIYQAVLARYPKNRRAVQALQQLQQSAPAGTLVAGDPAPADIQRFKSLLDARNFDEALNHASSLQRKFPGAAVVPNMAGTALIILGRHEEAITWLQTAVGLQPSNHEIICNLAGAHNQAKNYRLAHEQYTKAIGLKPDYAPAYANRARVSFEAGQYESAIKDASKALELDPANPGTNIILGRANFAFSNLTEALACFDTVLETQPDSAQALASRAATLVTLGRITDAVADYEHSLRINPNQPAAHYALSRLKSYKPDDPQLRTMQELSEHPEIDNRTLAQVHFGIANAYESLGDTATAFRNLALGNRARDDQNEYSIETDRRLFADIKEYFSNQPPAMLENPSAETTQPIFIVGMPRSGTTLTEQILASHSQVHGAGELRALSVAVIQWFNTTRDHPSGDLARTMLKHIRRDYFTDTLVAASQSPRITDKMPMNFRWIGFILAAFPEAKIVHLTRDPMAVCWSIYRQLFSTEGLKFAYDLDNLGQYYLLYQDLMTFWNDLYPGRIFELNYETLTQNQELQTRALLNACDLDWEDACLDFHRSKRSVSTASATQVRRKMYQGSSAAWKKYESEIETLRDVLGQGARD